MSSLHGPNGLGYTRTTKVATMGSYDVNQSESLNTTKVRIILWQLGNMKLESTSNRRIRLLRWISLQTSYTPPVTVMGLGGAGSLQGLVEFWIIIILIIVFPRLTKPFRWRELCQGLRWSRNTVMLGEPGVDLVAVWRKNNWVKYYLIYLIILIFYF